MLLTCRNYLNHDSHCDCFAYKFLVWSFFEGVISHLLYNTGWSAKRYILLHKVDRWSENPIFALYNMRTASNILCSIISALLSLVGPANRLLLPLAAFKYEAF